MRTLLRIPAFLLFISILGRAQDAGREQPGSDLLTQITTEYEAKNYIAATDLCRELIQKYPHHRDVQTGRAQLRLIWCLHYQDRHDEAAREAKAFVERFPEHSQLATAYYIMGIGYEQMKETGGWHEKAQEAYRKAIELERSPSMVKQIQNRLKELNERAQDSALKDRETAQTDPARTVIINDPLPSEEGFPPKANLGTYVILTDIAADDPYAEAVERLVKLRKPKDVVRFVPGGLDDVALRLKELGPEYVCIVTKPENIDVNVVYQVLEMSTKLDSDPFPDFVFGFITGETAADAIEFVRNIAKWEKRHAPFPKKILQMSKSDSSRLRTDVCEWATGFTSLSISYAKRDFLHQNFDKVPGAGILILQGSNATPEGITDGLSAEDVAALNISPAVVFSAADFTGVTTKVIRVSSETYQMETRSVSPETSLCLQVIGAGATGYFAPIGGSYSLLCTQEIAILIRNGAPLGHVIKHTHDGLILAQGEGALHLPPLLVGKQRPSTTSLDGRVHSAANRVLYGDPYFRPLPQGLEPVLNLNIRRRPDSLRVACQRATIFYDSTWQSAYRTTQESDGSNYNDEVRFTFELPRGFDKDVKSIAVQTPDKVLAKIKPSFIRYMVEKWGGKRLGHFQMDFPSRAIRQANFTFEIALNLEK
ncbi:MAG: outer membrane protein assembly factor BamD [Planctomycetota bacterium]